MGSSSGIISQGALQGAGTPNQGGKNSWMIGINAGWNSRSLKSEDIDTGIDVGYKKAVGFHQSAVNLDKPKRDTNQKHSKQRKATTV